MNSSAGLPSLSGETSWDSIRETVHKRIVTFIHLRRVVSSADALFFNVVKIPPEEMTAFYNPTRMRQRTHQYLILGLSLGPILDISNPQDFLKALAILTNEYQDYIVEGEKQRKKNFFRKSRNTDDSLSGGNGSGNSSGTSALPSNSTGLTGSSANLSTGQFSTPFHSSFANNGTTSTSGGMVQHLNMVPEGMTFDYLQPRNFPFELDYIHIFDTLCEVICLVYNRITETMVSLPHSQSLQDTIVKIDAKFKKIISTVTKELDDLTRQIIQDEFTALGAPYSAKSGSTVMSSSTILRDHVEP
ncbi:hypothetical protein IWQ62_002352 [Dispira parvispora]|uniref:Uncharacterized protein n=1 Tax=Dispira parvispora TaxID=1520584 RepID=A0A9W8AVV8_9FUNG|nr:hypothetical protein IWQ62_002352 [Dispira parvispora]